MCSFSPKASVERMPVPLNQHCAGEAWEGPTLRPIRAGLTPAAEALCQRLVSSPHFVASYGELTVDFFPPGVIIIFSRLFFICCWSFFCLSLLGLGAEVLSDCPTLAFSPRSWGSLWLSHPAILHSPPVAEVLSGCPTLPFSPRSPCQGQLLPASHPFSRCPECWV